MTDLLSNLEYIEKYFKRDFKDKKYAKNIKLICSTFAAVQDAVKNENAEKPFEEWTIEYICEALSKNLH